MTVLLKYLLLFLLVLVRAGEPPQDVEPEEHKAEEHHEEIIKTGDDSKLFNNLEEETDSEDPSNKTVTEEPKNVTESIESIVLPEVGSAAKEHSSSLAIFFLLFILILSIFLVHFLLKVKFHYLPESLAMGKFPIHNHHYHY